MVKWYNDLSVSGKVWLDLCMGHTQNGTACDENLIWLMLFIVCYCIYIYNTLSFIRKQMFFSNYFVSAGLKLELSSSADDAEEEQCKNIGDDKWLYYMGFQDHVTKLKSIWEVENSHWMELLECEHGFSLVTWQGMSRLRIMSCLKGESGFWEACCIIWTFSAMGELQNRLIDMGPGQDA